MVKSQTSAGMLSTERVLCISLTDSQPPANTVTLDTPPPLRRINEKNSTSKGKVVFLQGMTADFFCAQNVIGGENSSLNRTRTHGLWHTAPTP